MKYDRKNRVIYFSDVIKGTIEAYDTETQERSVIYRGLIAPKTISLMKGPGDVV